MDDTHDDQEPTSADRAQCCQSALETYSDAWDARTNLIDFLTDARHWCDANRLSFAELDRTAYRHYAAERAAELRRRP